MVLSLTPAYMYTSCIGVRRKTNVKNKTWAATEPVLLRYFTGLRKRLQLGNENGAHEGEEYEDEEPEPDDVNPEPEDETDTQEGRLMLDDEDDPDEDDELHSIQQALPNGCVPFTTIVIVRGLPLAPPPSVTKAALMAVATRSS